jgi:hypothetical protein
MSVILEDIYRSSNGDRWRLITNTTSGQSLVRHEANLPSGGHVTDVDMLAFLAVGGSGPEYAALRALLRRREGV